MDITSTAPDEGVRQRTHVVIGAGPVARAVVNALAARGLEPAVVTRSGTPIPGAVVRRADVTDRAAAMAVMAGASVVYQCAEPAYHRWPEEFPALQTAVLDAAASTGALFVAAENLYGYAPPTGPMTESLPLAATTSKGTVRARMWAELEQAHVTGRVRVVAARASDFFGPGVAASAVGEKFFRPLVGGKPVQVVGDPDRLHTYTYVVDYGEAMVRLSETKAAWGRAWHVPNAPTTTTRAFADLAAGLATGMAGTTANLKRVKPWQLRIAGILSPTIREINEMRYEFDADWVVDHAGYESMIGDHSTPLDAAIGHTLAAHRPVPMAVPVR